MAHAAVHSHALRPVWAGRVPFAGRVPSRPTAVHDFMALMFLAGGSAVVHQRERFEVRTGDVYLVPAGERHGLVAADSPDAWGVGFYPACFVGTELASLLGPFHRAARGASTIVPIPEDRQAHLAQLCAQLHRETEGGGPGAHGEIVQRSLLGLILAEIGRAGASTSDAGAHAGFVGDALRFIERRCLGPISLADVARAVHRSPSHVSTVVRRATGKSVVEWIIAGRLAEARNRLLRTDARIDAIAEQVGYDDATHFIRLFRRVHGCTPTAFRSRERQLTAIPAPAIPTAAIPAPA